MRVGPLIVWPTSIATAGGEGGTPTKKGTARCARLEGAPNMMVINPMTSSQTITFGKNSVTWRSGGKTSEANPEVVVEVHESSEISTKAETVAASVDKFWEEEPTNEPAKEPTKGNSEGGSNGVSDGMK
mmetsp:Transcript_70064/g.196067  ORF Transcript_70064/g.196067 Transcript_70064/m.196067 type:complete len:129 (+) Transcript_70064:1353-1739(+)